MKRALAIGLVIMALAPAAALLASALDCHSMPCCARSGTKIVQRLGCCEPVMCSEPAPTPVAKSTATIALVASLEPSAIEEVVIVRAAFEVSETSPPRSTRLRLATLSTLLI